VASATAATAAAAAAATGADDGERLSADASACASTGT